jgi:hypothetical protein
MSLLKKITAKTVLGDVKKIAFGDDKQLEKGFPAMRVLGVVRNVQTGTSDYGDWVKFKGSFKATNLLTGEEFNSSALMLPEVASDLLDTAIQSVGDDFESIECAFDIGLKGADTSIGYEYTVTPLVEMSTSDPIVALEKQLPAMPKVKQLENKA